MSTSRPRPSRRSWRPGRRAGTAAVLVSMAATAVACQIQTEVVSNCTILGPITQTVRSNAKPDDIAPGGTVTNEISVTVPAVSVSLPVDRVTHRWPIPAAVVSIDAVTFAGGNLSGSWQVIGHDLVLAYIGHGAMTDTFVLPSFTVTARVDPAAPGGTMAWPAPWDMRILVSNGLIEEVCTPTAGTPEINNSNIAGPANPGWTPPGSIGSPRSATTLPLSPTTTTTIVPPETTTTTTFPPDPDAPPFDTVARMQCRFIGAFDVDLGTVHTPEPATAGGRIDLTTAMRLGPIPVAIDVRTVRVTLALPPEIRTITGVDFTGGNLTGSFQFAESTLTLTYVPVGTVRSNEIAFPTAHIHGRLGNNTEGTTIIVPVPSRFEVSVSGIEENCQSAPGNPPLETIRVRN